MNATVQREVRLSRRSARTGRFERLTVRLVGQCSAIGTRRPEYKIWIATDSPDPDKRLQSETHWWANTAELIEEAMQLIGISTLDLVTRRRLSHSDQWKVMYAVQDLIEDLAELSEDPNVAVERTRIKP